MTRYKDLPQEKKDKIRQIADHTGRSVLEIFSEMQSMALEKYFRKHKEATKKPN